MSTLTAIYSFWYLAISTSALPILCNQKISQFEASQDLVHQIAIIGDDDRQTREPGMVANNIENAQGRAYCLNKPLSSKAGDIPSKEDILKERPFIANATIAFEGDMVIVNRHMFLKDDGSRFAKIENCFFEHIASGQMVPMIDVEYPKMLAGKDPHDSGHRDVAIARLKFKPKNAAAVTKDMMTIDTNEDFSQPIKVISNYATNTKNRNSLTMTTCKRYGVYNLSSGQPSTKVGTDCDTGDGSSGAQAYIEVQGQPKLFGIVSGHIVRKSEKGSFDAHKLSTVVTTFDESLFESYERLKERQAI
ncbi:MAG: hypothetical protein KF799_15585 [Bdellovibrionales bacterium]|nr:hypothetical protein [Bdellovibrionales bacterium]